MPVFPWPEICCSRFTFSWSDIFRRKEYRGTKLLRAVTHRHVNCVKRLIDEGADVNTVNEYGVSPLMIAATHGFIECLSILIEAGAEVEIVTHKKTKTSLIISGTDTNRKQSSGKTALMRASYRGYSQCVEALLKAGADVNVVLEDGYTALMEATFGGSVKCVELLIDAGADVNMTNKHGKAAISLLPRHWYKSNIVEMLIRAGADVNAPDLYDFPQILSVAAKGTCEQLKFVIESGADVNAVDSHNNTALIAAVEQNVKHEGRSCLRVLLQAEAKINIVNNDHHNALSEHLRKQYQPDDNICLLLFAAGETVKREMIEEIRNSRPEVTIPEVLEQDFENDLDLRHLCRAAIRKHLLYLDPHSHLFDRVPRLGLPKSMYFYLVYDVSLETKCTNV